MMCVTLVACEGILDVDTSGEIVPDNLDDAGPAAIPTLVNGMIGTFNTAADEVARYAGLLTDELILAGTFPDRLQVDRRRVLVSNASVTDDLYTPIHAARFQADTAVVLFQARLEDPVFSEVAEALAEGIALGRLYGGYTRIWLAELFCWSILSGVFPETVPSLPNPRMEEALVFLEEAEALAEAAELPEVRRAAIVGQARALLWLGRYGEAAMRAGQVPRSFAFRAEFSNTNPDQYNRVYAFTWGDTEGIRWTIGDGTSPARGNERWEHLNEFRELNLLRIRPPGFTSVAGTSVPVVLQLLHNRAESELVVASGIEARLIRAEAHVRAGETTAAQELLNDLRGDFSARVSARWGVVIPTPEFALDPLSLTGDLAVDLKRVADERARELWLTGDRLTTARRLRLDPAVSIDLFPPFKAGGGDDVAFPIVLKELQNNPNLGLSQACPAGQEPGAWH